MTATWVRVVDGGPPVRVPDVEAEAGRAAWAAATQPDPCLWCGRHGHYVTVRLSPRPDETRGDVIGELVEACTCCSFGPEGHPERGLLHRLRSEQAEADDLDLTVELLKHGRWV